MRKRTREYMKKWRDSFWLYGEKPFLQFPALKEKCRESRQCCNFKIGIASGNNTVVTHFQTDTAMSDADKALVSVILMNLSFGGKKCDKNAVFSKGYEKRSGAVGSSIGGKGLLHSFVLMPSLAESIYINMLSEESIRKIHGLGNKYASIGKAPWESMPQGEDDYIARQLKESYMGRLVGLGRFIFLEDDKIYITEGIRHYGLNELTTDPSTAFMSKEKQPLWADTNKRPWRSLPSLLSFIGNATNEGFVCCQLRETLTAKRLDILGHDYFYIWSGGVKVSNDSGEQKCKGEDDFVESKTGISRDVFNNSFYENMTKAFEYMENNAKKCENAIIHYFKQLHKQLQEEDKLKLKYLSDYWQMCEKDFPDVIDACEDSKGEKIEPFGKKFFRHAVKVYNEKCPKSTPRQLEAWAAGNDVLCKGNKKTAGQ